MTLKHLSYRHLVDDYSLITDWLYLIRPINNSYILFRQPRSMVTDSVYGRKRSYTVSYTTVYMPYTLRIRPYFAVIHVIVLRSYITVIVYGEIRRNTEIVYGAFTLVNDRIFPVYSRLRPCFGKLRYIDRRFFAVSYHPVSYHRIYP